MKRAGYFGGLAGAHRHSAARPLRPPRRARQADGAATAQAMAAPPRLPTSERAVTRSAPDQRRSPIDPRPRSHHAHARPPRHPAGCLRRGHIGTHPGHVTARGAPGSKRSCPTASERVRRGWRAAAPAAGVRHRAAQPDNTADRGDRSGTTRDACRGADRALGDCAQRTRDHGRTASCPPTTRRRRFGSGPARREHERLAPPDLR